MCLFYSIRTNLLSASKKNWKNLNLSHFRLATTLTETPNFEETSSFNTYFVQSMAEGQEPSTQNIVQAQELVNLVADVADSVPHDTPLHVCSK